MQSAKNFVLLIIVSASVENRYMRIQTIRQRNVDLPLGKRNADIKQT
jgi:hypothetical protein